ncbi:MAG: hypothetical protein M1167_07770, partial [Chloroflexi bacterium]|nr:hypothetical protein [Chloroflexota bacterium]
MAADAETGGLAEMKNAFFNLLVKEWVSDLFLFSCLLQPCFKFMLIFEQIYSFKSCISAGLGKFFITGQKCVVIGGLAGCC